MVNFYGKVSSKLPVTAHRTWTSFLSSVKAINARSVLTGVLLVVCMTCWAAASGEGGRLSRLTILDGNYPQVFFFRLPEAGSRIFEGASRNRASLQPITYEQWDRTFDRLMGMEIKVLNEEEHPDKSRDYAFAIRFKKEHPNQMLLLHFNGDARDPRFESEKFFAGHWIYYVGAHVLNDIPAQDGETEIRVNDPKLFRTGIGRFQNSTDDIGLCELDGHGKPDWSRSEQVRLLSVNPESGTIRVMRGQYGTKPRAFTANRTYAAAHVTEGPWTKDGYKLWCYNFSTQCPRDAKRQNCADALVEDLASRLLPGGTLADFDGVEFDILLGEIATRAGAGRQADVNADGLPDNGVINGVNTYRIGAAQFLDKLRAKLGYDRIIQADGQDGGRDQEAFGTLNGIESEGFPHVSDYEMHDWSGGLNRLLFWKENSCDPKFSYINHKFNMRGPTPGTFALPNIPFSTDRLVFAAAMFTDSAVGYLVLPKPQPGELLGIWDELDMGMEHRIGWLGRPVGPAVRLAERQPDLFAGAGIRPNHKFLKHFEGQDLDFRLEGNAIKVMPRNPNVTQLKFRLSGIAVNGPDLFVKLGMRAQPMRGYPAQIARVAWVSVSSEKQRFMTFVNTKDFESGFYFSDLKSGNVDLEVSIEGAEPMWISNLAAFSYPDVIYRKFEHGLVLGNPSPHPYTFKLVDLRAGVKYRHLKGSPGQDTSVNDGSPVTGDIGLGAKDGLFLLAEPQGE